MNTEESYNKGVKKRYSIWKTESFQTSKVGVKISKTSWKRGRIRDVNLYMIKKHEVKRVKQ